MSPLLFPPSISPAARLRQLLDQPEVLLAPGCFDALGARVLTEAGHDVAFLGGFSVASARLGLPDVGLLGYSEMLEQTRLVCAATPLPVIADADTGYGNAVNAQRTFLGYAQAGAACVMIEDQRWPKRCGHTAGKAVVDRGEALARVQACVAIRDEHRLDTLIMARTDANATDGFDEALYRAAAFADAGADITFLEAPESEAQMRRYCAEVPGPKTANLVEDGRTPWVTPDALSEMGYSIALYPVTLLLHAIAAMRSSAESLRTGTDAAAHRGSFDDARALVGWSDYEQRAEAFAADSPTTTDEEH